ncbi:MAG: DNA gyrase modulator, partial [Candidatus Bathyarchaeia archaeon]
MFGIMKLEEISRFIVNEGIKLGADDVASISYLKKESMVRFSNNQVTVVKNWKLIGADIFIGIDRRIAISSLEEISKGAIKETLKNLIKIAKLSKQNENYTGLPKGPFYYRENETKYEYTSIDYNLIDYVESSINEA